MSEALNVSKIFGEDVFNDTVMKERLPKKVYEELRKTIDEGALFELNIEKTNPVIEVITGDKNKNYNHINPYVKTSYSDDIYKGIIIKYQDRIYDYSINERDV